MTPYENLANAIVLSAVKDYRAALKRLSHHPDNEFARGEVDSLECFFRSGWYSVLTDVDGEFLIQKLREEVDL